MKVNDIKNPVSSISGIGPQLTKTLTKINIFTVGDLLQYYPRDYEDRSNKIPIKDYKLSGKIHTVAIITDHQWFGYGNMKTLKLIINDGTGTAELVCFRRSFLEKSMIPGTIVNVSGRFEIKYSKLQSSTFEITKYSNQNINNNEIINLKPEDSKVYPIYNLTEGLTQKTLQKTIGTAISQYVRGIDNELPESLIESRNLLTKQEALRLIHQPGNIQEAISARNTLAYEELFHFQYSIAERAFKHRGFIPQANIPDILDDNPIVPGQNSQTQKSVSDEEFKSTLSPLQLKFLETLPFPLTEDQKNVIHEMNLEIDQGYQERNRILVQYERGIPIQTRQPFTMSRLLQGDVGSGKTLTAIFVCLRIISWKGQCAFMAPTEILARQHAETTDKLLSPLGIRTAFLTGNVKSTGRNQLLKALKNGEIDIIIGTHALFSNQVVYNDLQLAVIDEQHRFGVLQRQQILAKGRTEEKCGMTFEPHLLMMSATPIPQTLALTVFGDLDVSTIKTMPQGRKPIQTYLVKEGNEKNAYEAVRKELLQGHQAYFVYPAIDSDYGIDEPGDTQDGSSRKLKSAQKNFEQLSKNIYPEYKCAIVHSKIDEEEQNQILRDFNQGKIQVLAATTVIEVGVDVPNATCMVIEQADRFGMAQLHQLRGRVGRGSDQSYCFLIYSKNLSESGIERMKALRQSTDGFYIAEQDLKTRGPGEMNGTLQAGALELGVADVVRDNLILRQARLDAFAILRHQAETRNQ